MRISTGAQSAFTLVELLVVIAIIAVLTSVVISSLSNARSASVQSKIKLEMDAITKRASADELQELTFDVVCGTNGFTQSESIENIITSIEQFSSTTVTCNSAPDAYAISVPISSSTHWCVDSTGVKREVTSALTTSPAALACP